MQANYYSFLREQSAKTIKMYIITYLMNSNKSTAIFFKFIHSNIIIIENRLTNNYHQKILSNAFLPIKRIKRVIMMEK